MRKFLSVLLTLTLALSCSAVTFSATDAGATPDEAKKVTSIEMTQLPEKTEYVFDQIEAGWDVSGLDSDVDIDDQEAVLEALEKAEFFIDVDLAGAEITATYSDGSTEVVDNTLCTTSVADPASLRQFYELLINLETEEDAIAFMGLFIREYTINVEYAQAVTTFNVNVVEDDSNVDETTYVFESIENPHGDVYVIEEDLIDIDINEGYDDEPYICKAVDFDLENIKVTVRNKETGELETYSGDSIVMDCYFSPEEEIVPGIYSPLAYVITDSGEWVFFDYEIELVNAENPEESKPATDNKDDEVDNKTASTDTPSKPVADNGAVQTGTPAHAGLLAVVLLSGLFVAFMVHRKKIAE